MCEQWKCKLLIAVDLCANKDLCDENVHITDKLIKDAGRRSRLCQSEWLSDRDDHGGVPSLVRKRVHTWRSILSGAICDDNIYCYKQSVTSKIKLNCALMIVLLDNEWEIARIIHFKRRLFQDSERIRKKKELHRGSARSVLSQTLSISFFFAWAHRQQVKLIERSFAHAAECHSPARNNRFVLLDSLLMPRRWNEMNC
jgi:hypothetical protein